MRNCPVPKAEITDWQELSGQAQISEDVTVLSIVTPHYIWNALPNKRLPDANASLITYPRNCHHGQIQSSNKQGLHVSSSLLLSQFGMWEDLLGLDHYRSVLISENRIFNLAT